MKACMCSRDRKRPVVVENHMHTSGTPRRTHKQLATVRTIMEFCFRTCAHLAWPTMIVGRGRSIALPAGRLQQQQPTFCWCAPLHASTYRLPPVLSCPPKKIRKKRVLEREKKAGRSIRDALALGSYDRLSHATVAHTAPAGGSRPDEWLEAYLAFSSLKTSAAIPTAPACMLYSDCSAGA
jgi:hypothetical protein